MNSMTTCRLGRTDTLISRIGFGAMHLAHLGISPRVTSAVHAALEAGIAVFDTADRYCRDEDDAHINERQLAESLRRYPGDTAQVCIATKGGMLKPKGVWVRFGKPEHIQQTIRESFEALGGQRPITLWQYHQLDLNYPLEETLAVVREAVAEGLVRHVGVSNFNVAQLEAAQRVLPLAAVQSEFSLWCREVERNGVLDYCVRQGLTFLAWRPLGGKDRALRLGETTAVSELANRRAVTPQQLALAWLLARSPCVVPIPGSSRVDHIQQCAASVQLDLSPSEIEILENAVVEEPPSLRLHTQFF